MTAGYSPEAWGDLFLAAAAASAVLSGLIFVGLSVSIRAVLAADEREGQNFLTGRGLEALAALLIVLVISLVGLVPGIPRGALTKIGQPFEQVQSQYAKSKGGSGLGLAISRSLTALHGGSMKIRSRESVGTVISLRIPDHG